MAVNYPASLDIFINPSSNSSVANPSHSQQHSDANDAIEALEAKVGITGSTVTTSHDYRISQVESLVTSAVAGAKSIYQDVRNQSGSSLSKATPVYVSGSEGASGKMLISAASNAAESTSSKTMGITTSAIADNSNGQVISEGILEGIDTTGAADGDPVWLGTNGTKIYGLANKPSAPSHLVFLGIVIRGGQANTGSMYVKIQNGFEIEELHNVEVVSKVDGNILAYDSIAGTWKNTNTLQSTASTIPLIIKAVSSQTTNLFEVQSSTGTSTFIINGGSFSGSGTVSVGNTALAGTSFNSQLYVQNNNAARIGVIVKGTASQTANLQEWQNSSGTALGYVKDNGYSASIAGFSYIYTQGIQGWNGVGGYISFANAEPVTITPQSASVIVLAVKGATSQTASLQEWQNSTGTTLAKVNAYGDFFITGGRIMRGPNDYGANLNITNESDIKGVILRANASQTVNLTEWQDSTGNILNRILSDGSNYSSASTHWIGYNRSADGSANYNFTTVSGATSFQAQIVRGSGYNGALQLTNYGNSTILLTNGQAGSVVATVKGYASQTANLQEWQNSSGTVLANITSGGTFFAQSLSSSSTGYQGNIASTDGTKGNLNFNTSGYGLLVTSAQTSAVVLAARGAASQTGDLQQWQDSSGTVQAKIDSTGYGLAVKRFGVSSVLTIPATAMSYFETAAVGNQGIVVRGAASQTANLQEWQNSSGTVIANITPSGGLYVNSNLTQNASGRTFIGGANDYSAFLNVSIPTASRQGIVIRANTSQTANLQEWQDNSGTVLSRVDTSGSYWVNAVPATSGTVERSSAYLYLVSNRWDGSASTGEVFGLNNFRFGGAGAAYAYALHVKPAYSSNAYLSVAGDTSRSVGVNVQYPSASSGYGQFGVQIADASYKGIVVKSAASQTANLQEWQDSSGNVLTAVASNGTIRITNISSNSNTGAYTNYASDSVTIIQRVTTSSNLIIRAAVSQTADLQQWQNSAGTVLANIASDGALRINKIRASNGTADRVDFAGGTNWAVTIPNNISTTSVNLIIKAAPSQTANLQEWQDSAGTVYAFINPYGQLSIGQSPTIYSNARISLNTVATSVVGMVIRGVTSQTANLQEWQTQDGSAVASISPSGSLKSSKYILGTDLSIIPVVGGQSVISSWWGLQLSGLRQSNVDYSPSQIDAANVAHVIMPLTQSAAIGLMIRGVASQTGDLQQWQNNAGTALAKVDKDGNITAQNLTLNGDLSVAGTTTTVNASDLIVTDPMIYMGDGNQSSVLDLGIVAAFNNGTYQHSGLVRDASDNKWKLFSGVIPEPTTTIDFTSAIYDTLKLGTLEASIVTGINISAGTTSAWGILNAYTAGTTNIGLVVRGAPSQTASLQEWQDSSGNVVAKLYPVNTGGDYTLSLMGSGTGSGSYSGILIGGGWIRNEKRSVLSKFGVDTGEWHLASNPDESAIAITNNQVGVFANSTSLPTFTVKAVASQTAHLIQWQNSSGAVLGRIDAEGSIYSANRITSPGDFSANTRSFFANPSFNLATLNINTANTTQIGAVIRGVASQTANLQEWQDSTGGINTFIDPNQHIFTANGRAVFLNTGYLANTSFASSSYAPGRTAIIAKAAASQTANIQEWQNSSGTVLASIDSSGGFTSTSQAIQANSSTYGFNKIVSADLGATTYWKIATLPTTTLSTYDQINIDAMLGGWASDAKTRYEIMLGNRDTLSYKYTKFGNGLTQARIQAYTEADGSVSVYLYAEDTFVTLAYNITLSTSGSANGATIYKNPTGSTSAPTGTKSFDTYDPATYIPLLNINNAGSLAAKSAVFAPTSTTVVPLLVQGVASQTANLQEWKNSSGTTYLNITNAGTMISSGGVTIASNPTINAYGAAMKIASGVNTYPMLILQAASSQTADIQQWQNSGSTVIAKVDANGNFSAISKSFDIPHPTKENMRLRYASLEGNEHGVYVRGTTKEKIIELPDYWLNLVDEKSITVHLTCIGKPRKVYVKKIEGNKVYLGGRLKEAAYIIHAERKDIAKLTVEY